MAVSQYLREGSLLDAVRSHLTPDVVRSTSSLVGESEGSTRRTLDAAAPSMLGGLTNMVSTHEGASTLSSMIEGGGFSSGLDNVKSMLGGGSATSSLLTTGQQALGKIFGNRSSALNEAVANSGGVSPAAGGKIMALMAPLALGVLGKRAAEQRLDSGGVASMLLNEKSSIAAAMPAGLSRFFESGPTAVERNVPEPRVSEPVRRDSYETTVREPQRPRSMRWLPLLLIALVALGLIWLLSGRTRNVNVGQTATQAVNTAQNALEKITLPGGQTLDLAPGSLNYDLAHFLGDGSASAPKTFVFDHLNFESAGTQLTPDSVPTVNNLASILKAYPNAQVQLMGYTDNTGTPEANQTLSQNRADAVKGILVSQGVAAERITARGVGQENPVASNDTDEGRARNRRTELTVTAK